MNITPLTIYLWQLADKLISCAELFSFFLGFAVVIAVIGFIAVLADDCDDQLKTFSARILIVVSIFFSLAISLVTFVPSSKTVAMMVIIPEIANSKVLQQDAPDIYNAAVEALKGALVPEKERKTATPAP